METDLNFIYNRIANFQSEKDVNDKKEDRIEDFDDFFKKEIKSLLLTEVIETTYKFYTYTLTRGGNYKEYIDRVNYFIGSIRKEIQKNCHELEEDLFSSLTEFEILMEKKGIKKYLDYNVVEIINLDKESYLRIERGLKVYGFYELNLIKEITPQKQEKLIQKISESQVPYQIAMLNHLGFIEKMKNAFDAKEDFYKKLAPILDSVPRTIKGNINVLNPKSNENHDRYTSINFKEDVKNDYENICNF